MPQDFLQPFPIWTLPPLWGKIKKYGKIKMYKAKSNCIKDGSPIEAIITYPQYIRAVSSLKQQKAKESKNLKNIYYCGCCGRALFNAHYGTVFCEQWSFKTDSCLQGYWNLQAWYGYGSAYIRQKEAEIFLDRDRLSRKVVKRNYPLSYTLPTELIP